MLDTNHIIKFNPKLWIMGLFFMGIIPFFIWAKYSEIDQIAHASGTVIANAKTQEIQTANEGVIEEILVQEGQKVKKGDVIIKLEKFQNEAAYEASYAKVAALKATLTRLKAEVYAKDLVFDDELKKYPEFTNAQVELFHRRQTALNDEISSLRESLNLAQEELKMNLPLANGDIGMSEIIKLKRQISDLKGLISNKRNKFFQDAQAEMTKVEEELSTKEQELTDRTITLERTQIVSPIDAMVKNIIITTKGAKVKAGDVILQLVPVDDKLIIEAKLSPADISFVHIGQKALIKLDAYDYSIYGSFNGIVKYISPDTISEKTPEGEKFYFRVRLELDKNQMIQNKGKSIEISTGMTAQIDIVTAQRTILNYLTKPITKTFDESFHER